MSLSREAVRRELLRRQRARESLHTYALSIDIPTVPFDAPQPDEDLLGPARYYMAAHHAVMLDVIQRTVTRFMGRAIILLPPGAAKSLYCSVVTPTWLMAKSPGQRLMLVSYQAALAERQARRAMQIVEQKKYRDLWEYEPELDRDAAGDWSLQFDIKGRTVDSEMLAMGFEGGLTGNRANGVVIDDPVAGREKADSATIQQKIRDMYQDDLMSRLLPGAWILLVMTHWNENDLAGSVLPEDYDGRSGPVLCRDGLYWEVLNIAAKCERDDDPLGRQVGDYLWPEFYPIEHWQMFENAQGNEAARAWASLYQQRPTAQGSGRFRLEDIDFYSGKPPEVLTYVTAGDYAVTTGANDFSELGTFGVDPDGHLWEVDWWSDRVDTGVSTEKTLDMVARWRPPMIFNEGGVIDKAMGPLINLRMRQRGADGELVYTDRRALPSMQDKLAKCAAFQGRCSARTVHFRDNANSRRVVQQLIALPSGRYDDAADVCGLIGRACDQFVIPRIWKPPPRKIIRPFTAAWLEQQEDAIQKVRYR